NDAAQLAPHAFHIIAGFALVAVLIVPDLLFGPPAARGMIDGLSSAALAVYLLLAALLVVAQLHDSTSLTTFAALSAATVAVAWRAEPATGAVPAAAILAGLVMAAFAAEREILHLVAPGL